LWKWDVHVDDKICVVVEGAVLTVCGSQLDLQSENISILPSRVGDVKAHNDTAEIAVGRGILVATERAVKLFLYWDI